MQELVRLLKGAEQTEANTSSLYIFLRLNTTILLVFPFPGNVSFIISAVKMCCSSPALHWCLVSARPISCGRGEKRRGGVWRIVWRSLWGSHAFVINAFHSALRWNRSTFFPPANFHFTGQPVQMNPIRLYFGHSKISGVSVWCAKPNLWFHQYKWYLLVFVRFPLEASVKNNHTPFRHQRTQSVS